MADTRNILVYYDGEQVDYDLALSIAPYLGIKKDNALEIVKQIKSIVAEWRKVAKRYGISNSEQDLVENAFRY